jgi:hypothetical protein
MFILGVYVGIMIMMALGGIYYIFQDDDCRTFKYLLLAIGISVVWPIAVSYTIALMLKEVVFTKD